MERGSFTFYRSFYTKAKGLAALDKAELFDAICNYAFHQQKPEKLTPKVQAAFTDIKARMKSNFRRSRLISNGSCFEKINVFPEVNPSTIDLTLEV